MIRVTYSIGRLNTTDLTLHEDFESATAAFEIVKAIIRKEHINFPDCDRTCDEYMNIVYRVAKGEILKHGNHIFKIEFIEQK